MIRARVVDGATEPRFARIVVEGLGKADRLYEALCEEWTSLPSLRMLRTDDFFDYDEQVADSEKPQMMRPRHDPAAHVDRMVTKQGHIILLHWAGVNYLQEVEVLFDPADEEGRAILERLNGICRVFA